MPSTTRQGTTSPSCCGSRAPARRCVCVRVHECGCVCVTYLNSLFCCCYRFGSTGGPTTLDLWPSCPWWATSWDSATGGSGCRPLRASCSLTLLAARQQDHFLSLTFQASVQPDVGSTERQNPAHRLRRLLRGLRLL